MTPYKNKNPKSKAEVEAEVQSWDKAYKKEKSKGSIEMEDREPKKKKKTNVSITFRQNLIKKKYIYIFSKFYLRNGSPELTFGFLYLKKNKWTLVNVH